MKLRKLAKCSLAAALIFGSVSFISGCNKDNETTEKTEQEKTYNLYVQYMNAKGDTPLTYEQWLASIKGEKGDKGDKGDSGDNAIAPKVRINETTNYWEISTDNGTTWTSTDVKASAENNYDKNDVYKDVSNNFSQIYNEVVKSVVKITVKYGSGSTIGSGVVYKEDGNKAYILTSAHVLTLAVANPNCNIDVLFSNYVKMKGEFVYLDKNEDVAVICVEKNKNYQIAKIITNDTDVKIGDSVFAIGNPYGNYFALTTGVISANRIQTSTSYVSGISNTNTYVYNSTATVNLGSSGGPLFNSDGEVIAINSMFPNDTNFRNYNYSIPINHFINVANYISINKTEFIRGSLLLTVKGICDYSVEEVLTLQIDVQKGVYIVDSKETQLAAGKVITHVNGVEVITAHDYEFELLKYQKNSVIQLTMVDKLGNNNENIEVILK